VSSLAIEYVDWTTLRPHWANPRLHDTDAIRESVEVNGVFRAIITAADGTVLSGHGLYEVLGERGGGPVAITRLPISPDSDHAKRVLLADNRVADLGRYDDGLLLGILQNMESPVGTGYDSDDIDNLVTMLERIEEAPLVTADTPYRPPVTLPPREERVLPRSTAPPPPTTVPTRYLLIPVRTEDHDRIKARIEDHRLEYGFEIPGDALADLLGLG